jgi:hypothetical protein
MDNSVFLIHSMLLYRQEAASHLKQEECRQWWERNPLLFARE